MFKIILEKFKNKIINESKKEKIKYLEKQIEELDKQYDDDVIKPKKIDMGFNFGQAISYHMEINKNYIPKKIELEVKLRLLKGVD